MFSAFNYLCVARQGGKGREWSETHEKASAISTSQLWDGQHDTLLGTQHGECSEWDTGIAGYPYKSP